jgi:DNA helicase HerA-like ATPase
MANNLTEFHQVIQSGYRNKGEVIHLGAACYNGQVLADVSIDIPVSTLNRHGLIAGATGTGKTKTIQLMVEQLSDLGIPCLLMDIKGDMSGLAAEGTADVKVNERMKLLGLPWKPRSFPVEFLTLSEEPGVRLRSTISEFGPVLFSRILSLNETQASVVSLVFKFCDDRGIPLLDLKDFKKVLLYLTNEGKDEIKKEYGLISTASASIILRKLLEIEQQGAETFFGEPSFDPYDLMRMDETGKAFLNIIRLTDIQNRPRLFSTFMLGLLAEIYYTFPEEGDIEKPKLVMFIDEAHLVFKEASNVLLDQIETIIKLIRSKGVGIFFCTQSPADIPRPVLAQLGLKIQHALRAFTARDRKDIKLIAENFPLSDYYDADTLLTELGVGEALVTALNEKGIPTPLVHVILRAPESRMDILTAEEMNAIISRSALVKKYNQILDRESAYEILTEKLKAAFENAEISQPAAPPPRYEESWLEIMGRTALRTIAAVMTRSLLGSLGIPASARRRRSGW